MFTISVLTLLLGLLCSCTCDCPDGFVSHHGSCYKTFGILANWLEAQTYCNAYGGFLVEITDEYEEHFITGYLQRLGAASFHPGMFWLGGTDSGQEGHWLWAKTAAPFTVTNWKNGEPNNAGGGENCVQLSFKDSLKWNDMSCINRMNFICEVFKDSTPAIVG